MDNYELLRHIMTNALRDIVMRPDRLTVTVVDDQGEYHEFDISHVWLATASVNAGDSRVRITRIGGL